ncbi:MAG TPA: uracil-DNA glycosylase [Candidatus Polarisedimenticolaceae bacterium]|nr:uracil-DNA glycosylase [Candidatus Polarisedimenticolaceae bacterium]
MADSLDRISRDVVRCERCPRLRSWCEEVARVRRRAFRDETYWGRPVPGFGDPAARILLVGLAPAAHGANRTGRMFTGDDSGNWLYAALHAEGLASQPTSVSRDDGLKLTGAFITATCRCAPPDNKPTPEERLACSEYLDRELDRLQSVRVVLALGKIGWDAVLDRARRVDKAAFPKPVPAFWHGSEAKLVVRKGARPVVLLGSYHPSRQNTNTGVLTREMLAGIMRRARVLASPGGGR